MAKITNAEGPRCSDSADADTVADGAAQAAYAPPSPAAAPGMDATAELQKLAQLHQSGVLPDTEFAAVKQKLFGV